MAGGTGKREILIRTRAIAIRARLLDTPTADRIWHALPIYAHVRTWGREVYFTASIACGREAEVRDVVVAGELAYWPDGDAIAIGFGPTPASQGGEIRLASPCNIWAVALDDVTALGSARDGDPIAVIQADS
ncbi:MAG: cyclophilin-like family protein [Hyphomicrobiaceae bacterium]